MRLNKMSSGVHRNLSHTVNKRAYFGANLCDCRKPFANLDYRRNLLIFCTFVLCSVVIQSQLWSKEGALKQASQKLPIFPPIRRDGRNSETRKTLQNMFRYMQWSWTCSITCDLRYLATCLFNVLSCLSFFTVFNGPLGFDLHAWLRSELPGHLHYATSNTVNKTRGNENVSAPTGPC